MVNVPRIRAITSSAAPANLIACDRPNYPEMARRTTVRDLHVNRGAR